MLRSQQQPNNDASCAAQVANRSLVATSLTFFIAACVACTATWSRHSLLTASLSWVVLFTYCITQPGATPLLSASHQQAPAFAAGALFAVAQLCERALEDGSIWWAKALLPVLVYASVANGMVHDVAVVRTPSLKARSASVRKASIYGSPMSIAIITLAGLVALGTSLTTTISLSSIALGLSYASVQVLALCLVERARKDNQQKLGAESRRRVSATGLPILSEGSLLSNQDPWQLVLQDVSLAAATVTLIATVMFESLQFGGLVCFGLIDRIIGEHWMEGQVFVSSIIGAVMVLVHCIMNASLVLMVRRQGAFSASAVLPSAAVCARLLVEFSLPRAWFSSLYASAVYFLIDERDLLPNIPAMQTRGRIILRYLAVITFTTYILWQLRQPFHDDRDLRYTHAHAGKNLAVTPPPQAFDPLQLSNTQVHPIAQLAHNAEATWKRTLQSQSHTIEQAVTEYRRRYGIPPPPNFDKWFDFARHRGVQLIDEYDSIYHSLLPFWGLKPATIRGRAREVLGFENNAIMGLLVRDGKVVHVEEGSEWFQQAIVGMMEDFVQHLPDMDIVLNLSDEPRVVIPHDELERLIKRAHQGDIAESSYNPYPKNEFGPRPADMSNGKRIAEVKTTRFNQFAHQPTWIPSRMSCPLDSPARALDDLNAHDNLTAYALSELGFIYNQTAFSDICNSPSFATSHGFFDRPNAFSVVHDLFPIFSQSKMSSYQDITYPSPWYWFGKVTYTTSSDPEWEEKEDKLWWRGSTTGGFSRAGGWKRQHRQQVIRKLNALDDAKILQKQTLPRAENAQQNDKDRSFSSNPAWSTVATPRASYPSKLDAYFSSVGQCDAGDCDAQREFFHIAPAAEQQEAWRSKYLLDLDGNAFSGRFYAFLKSRSLVFKMAVFREWHSDSWLIPWVHYVPLSLRGEESLEALRYLDKDDEGRALARKMSRESTKWAEAALRKEDFEVWLFRLLLEYGRVLNDDRAQLGYGPTARTATGSHDDAEPERH